MFNNCLEIKRLRQRNKSINIDNLKFINYSNNKDLLSNSNFKRLEDSSSNQKTNVPISRPKHLSNNNLTVVQPSISSNSVNNMSHKFKPINKENISKKAHSRNISINVPSTPEIKAIYHFEEYDIDNLKVKKNKKVNFFDIINSPQNNQNVNFKINFLRDRYGDKFNQLIEIIDKSENALEALEDVNILKGIIGDDYKIAQSFLKFVVAAYNK
jgi:hypothetical protein